MSSILRSIVAGVAGAAVGLLLGIAVGAAVVIALGVPAFEGQSATLVALFFAPAGVLAGAIAGIVWSLRRRNALTAARAAGHVLATFAATGALAAAGFGALYGTRDAIAPNQAAPRLHFEIRLPEGAVAPKGRIAVDLQTDRNTMPATLSSRGPVRDGPHVVIAGEVEMYFHTSRRMLVLKQPGRDDVIFELGLASNPPSSRDMSAWQRVRFLASADAGAKPRAAGPGPEDGYELRHRVSRAGEP